MRVVISDRNVAFAESLGHVLSARGASVVAIVQRLPEAAVAVSRQPADVCLAGIGPDSDVPVAHTAALHALAQRLPVILLAETISPALRATSVAAGVRGLGEMRQGMSEILHLLDRVGRGETVLDTAVKSSRSGVDSVNDVQRLARFLSKRERAVLSALVRGDDTASIAREFGISRTTTRGHVQGVLTKLGTHSRVGAVTLAVRARLVDPRTGEWLVP